MDPARLSAMLRQIASDIDESESPSRSAAVRAVRRALASLEALEMSKSPSGPWQATSPDAAASAIEAAYGSPDSYADGQGTIVFLRKGGKIWAVSDVSFIHGDDAITKYDITGVDEDGGGTSDPDSGSFDDLMPVLQGL